MAKPDGGGGELQLQCVGRLEIARPKPVVGFLCGSIPVPTDKSFHHHNTKNVFNSSSSSALIPSSHQSVKAPRYRMLPTETDLNSLPDLPHELLPRTSPTGPHQENSLISQNLARKCEALAVSGLAEYGDEIDVVAPADILKQIFKIPYSKARLSIAVHRIGQTLVLNSGPDIEEGEKLVRRHSSQSKCADQSLFLNFAMHSVRAEACDCPPTQFATSDEELNSTILPGHYESREDSFLSSTQPVHGDTSPSLGKRDSDTHTKDLNNPAGYPQVSQDKYWKGKRNNRKTRHEAVKKASQIEKSRGPIQESERYRRIGNDSFLRVLFWQFHNFRMLLGSDLLLFSNEKYVAVSLHLWDVTRQVTPLTWLEAWLDNVMASVPELAICYHQNGVIQGYELLKTDDIFLLKGISEDGTPAFHPQVVQQNGHSVLRFLQDNCKQDPGAYWLYKNAGDDVIQLFDLSVIPKTNSTEAHDGSSGPIPSMMDRGRRDSLFSLGTLLFRLAHRLSLSVVASSRGKCARLFQKCFDFLDEQDHLVVRALAHEQFARLILRCYEELDVASELVALESEVTVTDAEDEDESSDSSIGISEYVLGNRAASQVVEDIPSTKGLKSIQESISGDPSANMTPEACTSAPTNCCASGRSEMEDPKGGMLSSNGDDMLGILQMSTTSAQLIQTVPDPISTKLAAIHHVSQAIKSLRWKRQLQNSEAEFIDQGKRTHERTSPIHISVCACGDADCIEVCDIREWLPRSKMDHKLWKLVLLLGESYLALGEAYKEDGQFHQALKVVDLACSIYGSMPQHFDDAQFISSMTSCSSFQSKLNNRSRNTVFLDEMKKADLSSSVDAVDQFSSTYLFWAKAWTLVGDVYVEFQMKSTEISVQPERREARSELRISNEVEKEVKRLKKKLGQFNQNCSTCSLLNCSCQSDRASSGNSASSSSGNVHPLAYGRKQSKRSNVKNSPISASGISEDHGHLETESANASESGCLNKRDDESHMEASNTNMAYKVEITTTKMRGLGDTVEMHDEETTASAVSEAGDNQSYKGRNGGIFKFLEGLMVRDVDYNLSAAISCYDAARKALSGLPTGSSELQSVVKKKGWVCNELGRNWLGKKDLEKAELAFADAIKSFKEVSDHTNIILINCNLGHGRRALAEEMVSKMERLKSPAIFLDAFNQSLGTAKLEYSESLRYYGAARSELNIIDRSTGSVTVSSSLRNEVYTQLANTYLRLGMLLAREDISTEVYENGALEDQLLGYINSCDRRARKELRKREISANDAIREALSLYESLGELRKQESAYAYFQLACYHRDSCLKFLHQSNISKKENSILQKAKQYASLAERNWQKSIDFYGPTTHPAMFINILTERSTLSWILSQSFHSNAMLESALHHLFEARYLSMEGTSDIPSNNQAEVNANFKSQLQVVLKKMLQVALSGSTSKTSGINPASSENNKAGDVAKLRELYGMSLKLTDWSMLHAMYRLWML